MTIKHSWQETDSQLIFIEQFLTQTIQGNLLAVGLIAALVISYLVAVFNGLYELITDFSSSEFQEFIGTLIFGAIFPIGIAVFIGSFARSSDKRLVFDKANNQFRYEAQPYLYQFAVGQPKCRWKTELSAISEVKLGQESSELSVSAGLGMISGFHQTTKFDTIEFYEKGESNPFFSMSLAKSSGSNPYPSPELLTEIIQKITNFLDLDASPQ